MPFSERASNPTTSQLRNAARHPHHHTSSTHHPGSDCDEAQKFERGSWRVVDYCATNFPHVAALALNEMVREAGIAARLGIDARAVL